MRPIRVIAVDDEPLALKQLETYVAKVPFLELVAACHSALDARRVLEEQTVEAMFLDINMPDLSGLDFVRSLPNPPMVVFTTAFADYAVEGFRVNAVDYLLKPFSLADFISAANRLQERFGTRTDGVDGAPVSLLPQDNALFFRADGKSVRVRINDILYVEGMNEYVKVWRVGDKIPLVVLIRLKALQDNLPQDRFMRVHRSYIINLAHIREAWRDGVVLDNGKSIPVGDLYRQEFRDYLSKNSLG